MCDSNQKIIISDLKKQRDLLMGIAAFMILFYHLWMYSDINGVSIGIYNIFVFVLDIANSGVDLFLLLSGYGIYYSLKTNTYCTFYKKRLLRILPEYVISISLFSIISNQLKYLHILIIQKDFFTNGDIYFWYVPFILIVYLASPLLKKIIKGKASLIITIVVTILGNIALSLFVPNWYNTYSICITRIPIFVIGYGLGLLADKNEIAFKREKTIYAFVAWFGTLVFIMAYGIKMEYFILNLLYIPLIVSFVFVVLGVIKTNKHFRLLRQASKISFSMYLAGEVFIPSCLNINAPLAVTWTISALVVIGAGILIHIASSYVRIVVNKIAK